MVEEMILTVKKYLPLSVKGISYEAGVLNFYGDNWTFATLSAWRIITKERVIKGCFDNDIDNFIENFKLPIIVNIKFQSSTLVIDPVFIFSDDQMLEIFSTDTYEPWTLNLGNEGFYSATPNEPSAFEDNKDIF